MAVPSPSRHGREAAGLISQDVPGTVGTGVKGTGRRQRLSQVSSQSQQDRTLRRQEACLPCSKTSLLIPVETPIISCISFFFSWFLFFLIFYTGVLVSAIQQRESAIITHIPPLSGSSLPCHQPAIWVTTEGQTELALPCFPSAVRFAHSTVYMLMTRSPFVPLFPSS